MTICNFKIAAATIVALSALAPASAQNVDLSGGAPQTSGVNVVKITPIKVPTAPIAPPVTAIYQQWMSPEIINAWSLGYQGQGATIKVVDDFSSTRTYTGNLGTGAVAKRHGEWVRDFAGMIAPRATMATQDFALRRTVALANGLNILNLSYSMYAAAGYSAAQIGWSAQESSIIQYARDGRAVVAKAAANDAIAIGATNKAGKVDYLNLSLVGTQSAIFVGALNRNGTPGSLASLAGYSNFAGADPAVQSRFVSVGVRGDLTKLNGTSFAAPIISGYAAVVGSKFTTASPAQISNQILNTARQDTILRYDPVRHGRGEASIARALAPTAIR